MNLGQRSYGPFGGLERPSPSLRPPFKPMGAPRGAIVLINKYIYNIYMRHTDRICKLIKNIRKRLKKKE